MMKLQVLAIGALLALGSVQFAPAEALADGNDAGGNTSRFSAEELQLFEVFGHAYQLNGKAVRSKSMQEGMPTVVELSSSKNDLVRELAEMGLAQSKLAELYQQNRGALQSIFERQYREQWPNVLVKMLVKAASDAGQNNQESDIQGAAKLLEQLVGSDAQRTANEGLALIYFGVTLGNAQNEKIGSLADKAAVTGAEQKIAIRASIIHRPGNSSSWKVANSTHHDLHHCLILACAVPDRERILNDASGELLINELILPPVGFSRTTVEGTQQAVALRTMIANVPRGALLYVPRLPAGGTVLFQNPYYFSITKSAHVSLWCDEGTVDRQAVGNLKPPKAGRRK
jgi:hypothetical protein